MSRRTLIWIMAAAVLVAAFAWGASLLQQPAESAAALPPLAAAPTQTAPPTETLSPAGAQPTALATAVLASPTPSPEPTPTATLYVISRVEVAPREVAPTPPVASLPEAIGRIEIPALGINQPIVPVSWRMRVIDGQPVAMWETVRGAVGHHRGSAGLGQPGNTVLTGHTRGDGLGEFQNLWDLQEGQEIRLYDAQGQEYLYRVESVITLQEIGLTVEQRQENARYLQPTDDTRLTLVTCWPEWVYTHRVIVIARPG